MDVVNKAINEIIDRECQHQNPFTSHIFWGADCKHWVEVDGYSPEHNVGVASFWNTKQRVAFRLNGQRVYRRGRCRFELGVNVHEIDTIVEDGAIWAGLGEKVHRAFVTDGR
jgi:hypothetical protein